MADEGAATLAVLDTTGLDGCRGKDGERRREGDRDGDEFISCHLLL